MTKKQSKKALEDHLHRIFRRIGDRVQVPIMSLSLIFNAGRKAFELGLDEELAMQEVINKVREN